MIIVGLLWDSKILYKQYVELQSPCQIPRTLPKATFHQTGSSCKERCGCMVENLFKILRYFVIVVFGRFFSLVQAVTEGKQKVSPFVISV